jgi:hypothetical protein
MRAILVTALLLIAAVTLYVTIYAGNGGVMDKLEQQEELISDRIMRLNP